MAQPTINSHPQPRGDPPDPLLTAEELRDALTVAAAKAARLIAAVRQSNKEKKLLSAVLNLGTRDQP